MERTINGIPYRTALESLVTRFKELRLPQREDGRYYLEVETAENILHEIIGIANFSFDLTDAKIDCLLDGYVITRTGKLTILDDDGREITHQSAAGGNDIAMKVLKDDKNRPLLDSNNSEKKKIFQFSSDDKSAGRIAFKNCIQQLVGLKIPNKGKSLNKNTKKSNFTITLTKAADLLNNGMLKAPCIQTNSNTACELIVFSKTLSELAEKSNTTVAKIAASLKKGLVLDIVGNTQTYRNQVQIIAQEIHPSKR